MVVLLVAILGVSFYFAFYRRDWTTSPEPTTDLQEALSRVCTEPQSTPRYEGVHSFFEYLEEPPHPLCPPIVKTLGGRKDEAQGDEKNETSVSYEVEGGQEGPLPPYACLTEDRKSSQQQPPCVAYSFTTSVQNEVAEYAKSLGCVHHVFSEEASDIGRSSVAAEENSISEEATGHPRDVRTPGAKRDPSFPGGEETGQHSKPLEVLISSIRNSGQKIQLVNINAKGQEWPILTQLVLHPDLIDIQQVIARIHLPEDIGAMSDVEMHRYFSGLHQIVRGLDCLGYGVISSQPLVSEVVEIGSRRYPTSLQVSWLKKKSIFAR
ncbi:uncharacterized protein LOC135202290 isoform X2 [Macrobrachium nipponense]